MILETVFSLLALFKPVHVMDTPEKTCGAADRLMKETVKVVVSDPSRIVVNKMEWEWVGTDEDGDLVAKYQVRPDQYMSMTLVFNTGGAYLSIEGIDVKREPCRDMIYLKRVR